MNKYIIPDKVKDGRLSKEQINQWREKGYLLLDDLIEKNLLNQALDNLNSHFKVPKLKDIDELAKNTDFGSMGDLEFVSTYQGINNVTLSNNLIQCVKDLLDDNNIRLLQSDAWIKYGSKTTSGSQDNRDQRMHMDWCNNMITHPSEWNKPEAVAFIVYYDDSNTCGGETALVANTGKYDFAYQRPYLNIPGLRNIKFYNDKESCENYLKINHPEIYYFRKKLYEREVYAKFNRGSVLVYRHDIWHRGRPVNYGKIRRVLNIGYRKASSEWFTTWNKGWMRPHHSLTQHVEKLIGSLNKEQLKVLGFPSPESDYWTEEMKCYVGLRWQPFGLSKL